ncbi:RebB family R body protein [Vibrio sp. 10N.247.311.51]|uniref:RebB family R body protein n=1 Tax=Vibrio sp. 10N.247.311.51 TaxID=3229996 RepID=UPI00354B9A50
MPVTDSLTQVNTKGLGDIPAMATGNLFVATSQARSNSAHNMTNTVQQNQMVGHATTAQDVNALFSIGAAIIVRTYDLILTRD